MSAIFTGFSLQSFLQDIFCGTCCLVLILIFHGSAINHLHMRFQRRTVVNLAQHQYNRVFFHFYLSFIYIALIHLSEILIWSIFLLALDLSGSAIEAILFSGSCYTTVGFEPDILPNGWKTIAFFISLTGLFSLAWTTTIMIAMTTTYKAAWDQKYGNPDQGL